MSLRPVPRLDPSFYRPEPLAPSDLHHDLEQHVAAGFPADLALDLVLNELVVRAASVTGASGAAAALVRDDQMVVRAATGRHTLELGVSLSMRDGLSGACVRTRSAQLAGDTESDPRIDSVTSHTPGVRSLLIVPVLDDSSALPSHAEFFGVLEVFSSVPNAFSGSAQPLLAEFARECASLCRTAAELQDHGFVSEPIAGEPIGSESAGGESVEGESVEAESPASEGELFRSFELAESDVPHPAAPVRQPYQTWTLLLASLVILATIALSFMVGSRVGWLRALSNAPPVAVAPEATPIAATVNSPVAALEEPAPPPRKKKVIAAPKTESSDAPMSPSDQLVVYEKGKVVYRMKAQPLKPEGDSAQASAVQAAAPSAAPQPTSADRAPNQVASSVVPASSLQRLGDRIWLAPDQAATLLVNRVEPQYPQEALASRRSGRVVLEVNVAEDGTVSSVRPLVGDPTLAAAAAQAVRSWRYQPLRSHEQPSPFQTDVTLTFSLPN